jgi:hypothetical protein
VVWTGRSKHIDVPLNHPLRAAIEVSYDPPDRVRFAYDAAAFGPSRSGQVEVRLRTPQAAHRRSARCRARVATRHAQ